MVAKGVIPGWRAVAVGLLCGLLWWLLARGVHARRPSSLLASAFDAQIAAMDALRAAGGQHDETR